MKSKYVKQGQRESNIESALLRRCYELCCIFLWCLEKSSQNNETKNFAYIFYPF